MRGLRQRLDINPDAPCWAVALYCFCVPCFRTLRLLIRKQRQVKDALYQAKLRRRALGTCLPESESLLGASGRQPIAIAGPTSFLHLPPEIRQQIYDLAFSGPWILQPTCGYTLRGARPENWTPDQHIRMDLDNSATALDSATALGGVICRGGSGLHPTPSIPCGGFCRGRYTFDYLIYGAAVAERWMDVDEHRSYLNLMRTCRLMYEDLLYRLYGESTISLFGPDMVHYFLRNASPDGLRCIRYLHVGFAVSVESWRSWRQQKTVVRAFHSIAESLTNLQQLEVDLAFTSLSRDRPVEKHQMWGWLRRDLFDRFKGLEKFVLRLPVLQELEGKKKGFSVVPLQLWDESEYSILKNSLLQKPSDQPQTGKQSPE